MDTSRPAPDAQSPSRAPLLQTTALGMTFPGVRALAGVDFSIDAGEVHAVIGENGAGKSTLIRILTGEIDDYEGEITLDGQPIRFASPRAAIRHGIAVIPQELLLVGALTASENVCLGQEPRSPLGFIDRNAIVERGTQALATLGESALSRTPVRGLDTGQRQLIAIARALSLDARLVIMDEPSASLGPAEVDRLEAIVEQLASRGVAVVYISHRLAEVLRLADRITVLRDGRHVATFDTSSTSEQDLVRLMVGREIKRHALTSPPEGADELLRVEDLSLPDPSRPSGYRLKHVSFHVGRGEIVGLAGLIGAGRSDLLLALTGALDRALEGRIVLNGVPYEPSTPVAAQQAGLVLLPEDRATLGILPHQSVRANVTVGALDRVSRLGMVSRAREAAAVDTLIARTALRAPSPLAPIATLSGGNQQKAILARCLFASPSLLLLDEPTRGIDIAAKAELYELMLELARSGYGILLCSSELPELLRLCHRVLVFRDGRVAAAFDHADASEERIMAAAATSNPETPPSPPDGAAPPSSAPPPSIRDRIRRRASLVGLAAVVALAIVFSPNRGGRLVFLDLGNLTDILRQVAEKGILAAGMTPVIISGGIDLSVGSLLALAATVAARLLMHAGFGVAPTASLVLAIGAAVGLANGAIVARWRIQPFIVTLATMSAARGIARYISGGAAVPLAFGAGGAPEAFRRLGGQIVPFVPTPAAFFLAAVAGIYVLLAHTRTGRYAYAIGDNEPAARLCGVRVGAQKTILYVICGVLAALAGLVHCAQLEQGNPNDGVAYELDAIAAVVIGGTSLSGGVGTVGGTLVGTLIIGVINNSMGLNNIDANLQLILKGAIILGAVWLQRRQN
jgi:ABC-type sugar transport system ATPase subunit/ribose/xylose/arabinose/galactoside ABC-type transport system permease subunit